MDQETLNEAILMTLEALSRATQTLQQLVAQQELIIDELRAINKKLYTLNGITSRIANS